MRADALHIALATIARVDALVSWNILQGYREIEIRTPTEVIEP